MQPRPGQAADGTREYDGFEVEEVAATAPPVPFVRNYFKNERLWARLADRLAARIARDRIDVVHAQHVLTTVAGVQAARRAGVPVIATVRDYWPVCYWSDLIADYHDAALCPACTPTNMRRCLRARAGAAAPATWALIPYMRGNLARKRKGLAAADVVIAVSSVIADDLRRRAPELQGTRIEHIPNPVDTAAIRESGDGGAPIEGPYALYSGKLEPNKGAGHLVAVAREAALPWPLVIVGDGQLRTTIEAEARRDGVDVRVTGWLLREQALRWVRHASMLVFPSFGPESLSRVLLEAGALGVPIAAMDTGGTRDIVQHGETGLLSPTPAALAQDVARLVNDRDLARRLGAAARSHVDRTFDAASVVSRIEALYAELVHAQAQGGRHA